MINDTLERTLVRNFLDKDFFSIIEVPFDNRMLLRLDLIDNFDIAIFDLDYLYQDSEKTNDYPDANKLATFSTFIQKLSKFFPKCITLGLTSKNSRDSLKSVLSCGIHQFFLKPYDPVKFICKIYQVCLNRMDDFINTINNDHRALALEARTLAAKMEEVSMNKNLLFQRIRTLIAQIEAHHLQEEQLMEECHYPKYQHHRNHHNQMVIFIKDAFSQYQDGRINNIIKPILQQIKEDIYHDKHFISFLHHQHNQLIRRNSFDNHPCDSQSLD